MCFSAVSNSNANETDELTENVQETTSNQKSGQKQMPAHIFEQSEKMTNEMLWPPLVAEEEFEALQKVKVIVRTTPGPVSQLYFKPSTILGFLVWRFNRSSSSGGYPVRSFTAEYRNVSYSTPPYNSSFEHEWIRMDPINIAPNVVRLIFISITCRYFLYIYKGNEGIIIK